MNAFPARYNGLCNPCGEDIIKGESIVNHPDAGYVHEECAEDVGKAPQRNADERSTADPGMTTQPVMPRGLRASDRCDKCFIVHSPGQVECE